MEKKEKEPTKAVQVADLIDEKSVISFTQQDQLNTILNNNPPEAWIKKHPFVKDHNYLPIDKTEYLLQKLFKRVRIQVIETKMILNAVHVTVRVNYWNPVFGEWDFHDGVGAKEIQTQKETGSLNLDMSNINRGAVEMAIPIAKSAAIKDACDHLGKLFGRDLNRKNTISGYAPDENLKARYDAILNPETETNEPNN